MPDFGKPFLHGLCKIPSESRTAWKIIRKKTEFREKWVAIPGGKWYNNMKST